MKIIEGEEDCIKVYMKHNYCEEDEIFIETEQETICLTPLEANQIANILLKLCKETDYFKGLNKSNPEKQQQQSKKEECFERMKKAIIENKSDILTTALNEKYCDEECLIKIIKLLEEKNR